MAEIFKKDLFFILSLILGCCSPSLLMAGPPSGNHLKVLGSDGQAVVLELKVGDFQTETIEHEGDRKSVV